LAKAEDRRRELLELLADYVLAHGLGASSLRPLAKAAGLSDRMLLYYFKDKDELLSAILSTIVTRITAFMNMTLDNKRLPLAQLEAKLLAMLFQDGLWPYMCVWLELAALSAREGGPYRDIGHQIGQDFLAWGGAQLACANETERTRDAYELLRRIEGAVVLRSLEISPPVLP
jgi:AcrR family transcriptional regulator